jgi:hypothetical protein
MSKSRSSTKERDHVILPGIRSIAFQSNLAKWDMFCEIERLAVALAPNHANILISLWLVRMTSVEWFLAPRLYALYTTQGCASKAASWSHVASLASCPIRNDELSTENHDQTCSWWHEVNSNRAAAATWPIGCRSIQPFWIMIFFLQLEPVNLWPRLAISLFVLVGQKADRTIICEIRCSRMFERFQLYWR